jgi:hypothetical protein
LEQDHYLEALLLEIMSGVPKNESRFSSEPGFGQLWDDLASDIEQGGGDEIPHLEGGEGA